MRMNQKLSTVIALALFVVLLSRGRSADSPPAYPIKAGLAVGQKAPAFKLKGHDGKEYSLADLLKNGKVALVFYRSADW